MEVTSLDETRRGDDVPDDEVAGPSMAVDLQDDTPVQEIQVSPEKEVEPKQCCKNAKHKQYRCWRSKMSHSSSSSSSSSSTSSSSDIKSLASNCSCMKPNKKVMKKCLKKNKKLKKHLWKAAALHGDGFRHQHNFCHLNRQSKSFNSAEELPGESSDMNQHCHFASLGHGHAHGHGHGHHHGGHHRHVHHFVIECDERPCLMKHANLPTGAIHQFECHHHQGLHHRRHHHHEFGWQKPHH